LYKDHPERKHDVTYSGYVNPYSIEPSQSMKNEVARGRDPHKVMDNSKFSEKTTTHPMIHSLGHKQTFRPVDDEVVRSDYFRRGDHPGRMFYQRYKDYNLNYELENEYEMTRPENKTIFKLEKNKK
jgi:hypothetical protein